METPLDYKAIPPIPYKKTVSLVNNFVINTTNFLNKFSYLCEQKLAKVTSEIERLEITMNILEAKLASIPGLEGVAPPPKAEEEAPISSSIPSPPQQPAGDYEEEREQSEEEEAPPSPPQESQSSAGGLKVKDDPRYKRFFDLIRRGVLVAQIKMQMKAQGLDPNVLDDPEAESNFSASESGAPARSEEPEDGGPPPPPPPTLNGTKEEESEESSSEDE